MTGLAALVIDDDPGMVSVYADVFKYAGVMPVIVASTTEGLEKLAQKSYDLVITDLIQKPSGIDVYKLAVEKGIKHVYIITGGGEIEIVDAAVRIAGQNILFKPVSISSFLRIIKEAEPMQRPQS